MDFFISANVEENGWLDRGKSDIRITHGFGPPLTIRDVQEFRPRNLIRVFWWKHNKSLQSEALASESLPLGIAQANFKDDKEVLAQLEQHLDSIICNKHHLHEFAALTLDLNDQSQSSRTLSTILEWYQEWSDSQVVSN